MAFIIYLTVLFEQHGPELLWSKAKATQLVYYDVHPAPNGDWSLECNVLKSPDGKCGEHLETRPLVVYGSLANRTWQNHYFFAEENAIVSSYSTLTSWMPHYELLRGLTLGAFDGNPMLAVVFQPSTHFLADPRFDETTWGSPEQVAALAYTLISEVHGHIGVGNASQNLWQTKDPFWPYACYRYWRGGSLYEPTETWGTNKYGPMEWDCDGYDFFAYLGTREFVICMVYVLASVVLAMIMAAYTSFLILRALCRWKRSQVKIISRSPVFAPTIEHIKLEAARTGRPLQDLLVDDLPMVVYLECVVAKLDGDAFNLLRIREASVCALLQAGYTFILVLPTHIFVLFMGRPHQRDNVPTSTSHPPPFALWWEGELSLWSLPSYFLIFHYTVHTIFIFCHYIGIGFSCTRCFRYTPPGRVLYRLYWSAQFLAAMLSFAFVAYQLLLWLCSSVAINADYVLKLISVLGSIIMLQFVALGTAERFAQATDDGLATYEAEAIALASEAGKGASRAIDDITSEARKLEAAAMQMAANLDVQGKGIFWLFFFAFLLLLLAATWVLLGTSLWGSSVSHLTNLVMPGIVAALKLRADQAVQKVKETAPQLSSAAAKVTQEARSLGGKDGGRDLAGKMMGHVINRVETQAHATEAAPSAHNELVKRMKSIKRMVTVHNLVVEDDNNDQAGVEEERDLNA